MTRVEFCITKDQPATLSVELDSADARDILAEALFVARADWKNGPYAALQMLAVLGSYYRAPLVMGQRRVWGADVIVVDFVSRLISDGKAQKFSAYLAKHGVPE